MTSVRTRGESIAVTVDASHLDRKMTELKNKLPDELRKQLRKELSAAVKPLVQAQRSKVKGLSTSGSGGGGRASRYNAGRGSGPLTLKAHTSLMRRSGLRESVARTVRVVNRTRGSGNQLTVKSEGSRMPADQAALPVAMNKGKWRHPVFGNRKNWAEQTVPPGWFDKPITEHRERIFTQVEGAIDKALRNI
jgi:hypothetical protein